jgi:hypothetical protein
MRQEPTGVETELVILNDCPEQPISCTAAGVRVINLPQPINDASEKFNAAVAQATGELIAWWEDDDISLPHRLRMSMVMLERYGAEYIKPATAFVWQDGRISEHTQNLFFGGSMFRRALWWSAGGAVVGSPPDLSAHLAMSKCGRWAGPPIGKRDTWFVYRWGGIAVHHDSAVSGTNQDRFRAFRHRTLTHPEFRPGPQVITPGWANDYTAQVAEFIGTST